MIDIDIVIGGGGVAGAVTNDSGPLLFVVGAFGLIVATCYIQGDPRLAPGDQKIAELREEVPADGQPPSGAQPPEEGTGRPAPTIPSPTAT